MIDLNKKFVFSTTNISVSDKVLLEDNDVGIIESETPDGAVIFL
jgi:hypothetical protein